MFQKIGQIRPQQKTLPPRKEKERFSGKPWPKKILVNGFTQIPNVIIQDPGISSQELRVLMALSLHAMKKPICNPTDKTLAKETSLGEKRICGYRKNLRKRGYLFWRKTRTYNIYFIPYKVPNCEQGKEDFFNTPIKNLISALYPKKN